ncbi:MAG: helix-turn-helix domain-containing protein [Proteobacteria bacterium]|nr:helix-turn-helix domain-containing protein [Pseudomonadota bacterium]
MSISSLQSGFGPEDPLAAGGAQEPLGYQQLLSGAHGQSLNGAKRASSGYLRHVSPKPYWIYQRACGVIRQHLSDCSLSVGHVVAEMGCSRPTIYRAFAHHQQTVARVIRSMRLSRACELLATPPFTVPIETLAYRCGFNELRTFNRAFQREMGITAGEFRARILRRALAQN